MRIFRRRRKKISDFATAKAGAESENGVVENSVENSTKVDKVPEKKNAEPAEKSENKSEGKKKKETEEKTTVDVQGILFEAEAKEPLAEQAKADSEERREYYNGKAIALKLEEKNNSKLYVFPSLNGKEDEWYKMGGKSALFYKYLVGPRMGRSPKIRKDNDLRLRFRHGVAAIHWGNRFMNRASEIGYEVKRMEYGIIVVDLGKKFSVKEIKDMVEKEKDDKDKLPTMIKPKENMPDLYAKIRELARLLVPKVKTMHMAYRETFGNDLLDATADLFKIYFRVANGRIEKEAGKMALLERADDLTALVALTDEIELFDAVTRTRFGEYLVDIKLAIERNFKKGEKNEKNEAQ